MKNKKNLEKVLNEKGYDLEWGRYGNFECVPFAVKRNSFNNIRVALCYDTYNVIYKTYSIITVLQLNITKQELCKTLNNFENYVNFWKSKNYSYEYYINNNLGSIEYYPHKTIMHSSFDLDRL